MSWRRIWANSGYVMIATAALALLQWLIMAMIARREGSTALGEYALSQTFAMPASYLAWLSIRQQLIISGTGGTEPADFMFLRAFAPLAVFLPIVVCVGLLYHSKTLLMISGCVFALKYVEGFFDLAYGYIQKNGDWRHLSQSTIVRCGLSSVVFVVIYLGTSHLEIALSALIVTWVLIYCALDSRRAPPLKFFEFFDWSKSALARRWRLALHLVPLATSQVVMSLTVNAPRFLVEYQLGIGELGLFAAVSHFITVGSVAAGSIGHAILPSLAQSARDNRAASFWRQLIWTMLIIQATCAIGIAAAILFGAHLLRLIYGPAFADQGALLVAAAVAAGPLYCASIAAVGCYALQLRRALLASQVVAFLTVLIATAAMVPRWGNYGAVAGMLIAAAVQLAYCVGLLVWYWRRRHKGKGSLEDKPVESLSTADGG